MNENTQVALEELSIIIVTWNGDDMLSHCLASLKSSCFDTPEIIVVDNAHSKATREIANKYNNAIYIATEENKGFSGGNNIGLRHCHRKFIALLNNDTLIEKEPFTKLINYLKQHPNVGAVQGTLVMPFRGGKPDACGISMTRFGFVTERLFSNITAKGVATAVPVYAPKGALTVFRCELPSRIGGLFHDFYFNNSEDVDFGARIWLSGFEVHYVPTHPVQHLCGQTVSRLDKNKCAKRNLLNLLFTWLTVRSRYGAVRAICGWVFWHLFAGTGHWLHTQDAALLHSTADILWTLFGQRRQISSVRKEVQSYRKTSDREILRRVESPKPLSWYWRSFRGELIYEDFQ